MIKHLKKYWQYPVVAAIVTFLCVYLGEPYSRQDSHFWRMWLAVLGASFIAIRLLVAKLVKPNKEIIGDLAKRIYLSLLLGAIVFGIFNYYQFDKKWAEGLDDYTDIAYYYLNTKYLDELGYMGFYAAMLTADKEYKNRHATKIKRYRDLRDYEMKSTRVAFKHGQEIKENNFSKARWEEFTKDVDYFMARKYTASLKKYFFTDHGYNPPPTWAAVGVGLTSMASVGHIKKIAMVDVLWLVAMLVVVTWAFGFETMLYVALFFFCTFSGRWPVLSHSLLRFDWSCALVMGMAFMHKERYIPAGALMAYAALNRIFPAIFFYPWLVYTVYHLLKDRTLPKFQIKFIGAAAVVTIVLIGLAVGLFGTHRMKESATNLLMHNASYSSHRVGLGDLFVYEGEKTRKDIKNNGGLHKKELKVQSLKPTLWTFGLAALIIVGVYIVRTKRHLFELIPLAAIPMFCVTNAQINYYNLRMILIMWHASQMKKYPILHGAGLVMLFLTEILTHNMQLERVPRYLVTNVTSHCLAVYYGGLVLWMLYQIVLSYRTTQDDTSKETKKELPQKAEIPA